MAAVDFPLLQFVPNVRYWLLFALLKARLVVWSLSLVVSNSAS